MTIFHSFLYVYQRVFQGVFSWIPADPVSLRRPWAVPRFEKCRGLGGLGCRGGLHVAFGQTWQAGKSDG